MAIQYNFKRFLTAQETEFDTALAEIKNGQKTTHWIWFVFPQIAGLGFSDTSKFYAIKNKAEASQYLAHPVLGERLIEICSALLAIEGKNVYQIFGSTDSLKLKSSITLFNILENTNPVFQDVLDRFFKGEEDLKTVKLAKD